jgi:hypothetical protein
VALAAAATPPQAGGVPVEFSAPRPAEGAVLPVADVAPRPGEESTPIPMVTGGPAADDLAASSPPARDGRPRDAEGEQDEPAAAAGTAPLDACFTALGDRPEARAGEDYPDQGTGEPSPVAGPVSLAFAALLLGAPLAPDDPGRPGRCSGRLPRRPARR